VKKRGGEEGKAEYDGIARSKEVLQQSKP
jgi:hypothetical protein